MISWTEPALAVAAYLVGGIPFGLLLARFAGAGDIRTQGSGNIGATNVLRVAGRRLGALALILDMGKGALPVVFVREGLGWESGSGALMAVALAAVLGHLFPLYLGFKGGKGVATGFGVFLAWAPLAGGGAVLVWLAMAGLFRLSSLAALGAYTALPMLVWGLGPEGIWPVALVVTLLVTWRHEANIGRLLRGEEPRIGQKGEKR
ncbi:MAG: glycerol-3-phosphate 1-O-acyltransferase PlsY [Magnetococcales bacterium]|nr:glycerol-3-phosphate 1-O-acyltransferase PlsY [Magnetococcales bacterium]